MKRFTIWALLALMWLVIFLPEGLTQGSDMRLRDAFVYRKLDGRGGIPMFWDGFIIGNYAGTSRDCILYDYTGSGNYVIRLQGDSSNIFTIDKSGNVWAAGSIAPATGTKLPDIGGTNWLTLKWNETSAADRTLNFLVSGGNRSLTIEADSLLNQDLTTDATPTFAGMIGSGLTASRLLSTSATKALTSTALNSWVTGTANRLTVTDDGDGTITLTTPQDSHTGASPTFTGMTLSGLTNTRLVATTGGNVIASTSLNSWVAGTADDITVTDDGDGTITLSSVPPANTVTVGATGCDYTTIQAALTAVGANGLVLVYPGTYADDTINFTANNQTVRGADLTAKAIVTTADTQICNYGAYTGCRISNLKLQMTACTTAKTIITGSGSIRLRDVHLSMTSTTDIVGAAQPSCIAGTGNMKMVRGTITYSHIGETVLGVKAPVAVGAGAVISLHKINIDIDTEGDALATTIVYGTSTGTVDMFRCIVDVLNAPEVASGLEDTYTIGFAYATGSGTHEITGNDIHVEGDGNTSIGMYLAGTKTIRSMFNHIHVVTSSGTANSFYLAAAGASIDSQLDDIIAADGENNVAGGTYCYAHSPADGDWDISGDLTVNDVTLPQDVFITVANITPTGDGTSNATTDTRQADATANRMFNRSTGVSDTQDMDWYSEYELPELASGITTAKIYVRASDYANCAVTWTWEDQAGNADATGAVVITPTGDNTWEEFTYTFTSAYTKLEHVWSKIAITSLDTADTVDFGGIALDL